MLTGLGRNVNQEPSRQSLFDSAARCIWRYGGSKKVQGAYDIGMLASSCRLIQAAQGATESAAIMAAT